MVKLAEAMCKKLMSSCPGNNSDQDKKQIVNLSEQLATSTSQNVELKSKQIEEEAELSGAFRAGDSRKKGKIDF
jgi:hypothetical protein